jgi:hypothetical protein
MDINLQRKQQNTSIEKKHTHQTRLGAKKTQENLNEQDDEHIESGEYKKHAEEVQHLAIEKMQHSEE